MNQETKSRLVAAGKWEQYTDLKIKYVNDGLERKVAEQKALMDVERPSSPGSWSASASSSAPSSSATSSSATSSSSASYIIERKYVQSPGLVICTHFQIRSLPPAPPSSSSTTILSSPRTTEPLALVGTSSSAVSTDWKLLSSQGSEDTCKNDLPRCTS